MTGYPIKPIDPIIWTTEQHRAAVMAEIEAASYQDGKG